MRRAFIILALATAIFLHVCECKRAVAARQATGQSRTMGDVSEPVLRIADISASRQGERITVVGRISDIWEPGGKRAPHTIILRDDSAALEVVHWIKNSPRVGIGDAVQCTGTIDLYRGGLQLRLWASRDLEVVSP